MPIDIEKIVEKIRSGGYTRKNLEVLRENSLRKGGVDSDRVVTACSEELEKLKPKNSKMPNNKELGATTVWWLAIDSNRGHCSFQELKERKVVAQGWPKFGDLSKQMDFKYQMDKSQTYEDITNIGDRAYKGTEHWNKDRLPSGAPRVFWNLLNLRKGDLVVAIEGTKVRGLCELKHHGVDGYIFDPNYNYAHGFGGIVDWFGWDEEKLGEPPTPPRQSVKGISKLSNQAHYVIKCWESYKS
ncbi:hypothetical protein AB4392_05270 [Vibrio breoganii]